jgi:hypothetical protein
MAGEHPTGVRDRAVRVSPTQRAQTLAQAAAVTQAVAEEIDRIATTNPRAAQALAQAAAETLTAVASTVEGRWGGSLTQAAELFDKAARAGTQRCPVPHRGPTSCVAASTLRSYVRT